MHRLGSSNAVPAVQDASPRAGTDQRTAATGSLKRKVDTADPNQHAMQAELDALQQKNNSLMRKLTRVMHDSRIMQEENLTMRHIIAAVTGSPSCGHADAAFIHSRDTDQQQQLQRLSRRPSSAIVLGAVAVTPAAARTVEAAALAHFPVVQQGATLHGHATSGLASCALPMTLQRAAAAGLLPMPMHVAYPDASKQLDTQQQKQHLHQQQQQQQQVLQAAQMELWHCGLVQPEEPYHTRVPAIADPTEPMRAATGMAERATLTTDNMTPAEAEAAVCGVPSTAVAVSRTKARFQNQVSPEPALPVIEKAAAVLKSSEQAGLLHGAEVSNITAVLTSEVAVRCSSRSSDHSGSGNDTGNQAAAVQTGDNATQQEPQGPGNHATATTAADGQISQQLLQKVAARALAQAKGEASSALLQLVAAGIGVPVDTIADPLKL